MMVYLELYWAFLKIGFTSFGGMSMIPLIFEVVSSHGWMSTGQLTDLVAIAEMTPGPLGLNCATFAGTQAAGALGSLFAVAGVLTPSLTMGLLAAVYFARFRKSPVLRRLLLVIRPLCIAMLLDVILSLSISTYLSGGRPVLRSLVIGLLALYLLLRRKWSVPRVIMLSSVLGLIFFGALPV